MRLTGIAETVNEVGAAMVSVMRAVPVKLPDVPVMVRVEVDAAAELAAVMVRVLVVTAFAGLKLAVTPAGSPETARVTAPVKPCCGLMVTVAAPLAPGAMESAEADDAMLKPGAADVAVSALINGWPVGEPHPVARS